MHVAIVGGGIAGLAAAWRLKEARVNFTLIDRNPDLGGRCRTFEWNGQWQIRGAAAFIGAEENLIAQARALGIYDQDRIADVTHAHSFDIPKRGKVRTLRHFAPADILASPLIPASEKLALARVLPDLLKQLARSNGRDPESAVDLDTVTACSYFRRYSPSFVDYVLEPVMAMFCGYGEEDYSLAWLVWLMAGRYAWANAWWSFKDRGVGELTQSFEAALRAHDPNRVLTDTIVQEVRPRSGGGHRLALSTPRGVKELEADAVVMAVPGSEIAPVMPTLDARRRAFFDGVKYVGHHIVYVLTEANGDDRPSHLLLPTIEGFRTLSNVSIAPSDSGRTLIYAELKGAACEQLRGAPDTAIIAAAMTDIAKAFPYLGARRIVDCYVQRNDIALCSRHVGYTRSLAEFKQLQPLETVSFAGDYLLNSTVGSAHLTGTNAAMQILREAGVAR